MKENGEKCDFEIIAFVNGKRRTVKCEDCLKCPRKLVWGIGVVNAFAMATGRSSTEGIHAYVKGDCKGETS